MISFPHIAAFLSGKGKKNAAGRPVESGNKNG
jgi:hypothetical protein